MRARVFEIILGTWLFLSVFLWEQTPAQVENAWFSGLLTVAFATAALVQPGARWLNAALAVWIVVSVWVLPTPNLATAWNHVLTGVAIFVVAAPWELLKERRA